MSSETILVIDDDSLVLALTCHVLRLRGYTVLHASSADDALRIASQSKLIDLLLIDVMLPMTSGPATADLLRPMHPNAKIQYMSGYADDVVVKHLSNTEDLLRKPFSVDELVARVAEKLQAKPIEQPSKMPPYHERSFDE